MVTLCDQLPLLRPIDRADEVKLDFDPSSMREHWNSVAHGVMMCSANYRCWLPG